MLLNFRKKFIFKDVEIKDRDYTTNSYGREKRRKYWLNKHCDWDHRDRQR